MKRRFLALVVAALGAAYARQPVRSIAPNAIVTVLDFADGSVQFFLTGGLTRLHGDTVQTVSSDGTTMASVPIPEPGGPTTKVLVAESPDAASLGVVTINIVSPDGTVALSFSANTQVIMGYYAWPVAPNELWVYGYLDRQEAITVALDYEMQRSPEPTAGSSPANAALHLTDVSSGDHLLTVCQQGTCDTIPVRVLGIPLEQGGGVRRTPVK